MYASPLLSRALMTCSLYDVKGRFAVHRISQEEAAYKLCKGGSRRRLHF